MTGRGERVAATVADLCGEPLAGVDLATRDHHPCPAFGQAHTHGPAQAAAATGHQHHSVGDGKQRIGHRANLLARESNSSTTNPKTSWCGFVDSPLRNFAYEASSTIASFHALKAWYQSNAERARPVAAAYRWANRAGVWHCS